MPVAVILSAPYAPASPPRTSKGVVRSRTRVQKPFSVRATRQVYITVFAAPNRTQQMFFAKQYYHL